MIRKQERSRFEHRRRSPPETALRSFAPLVAMVKVTHSRPIALHFMYYNFVRIHQSLRTTPAMAAGVTDKLWDIADMVALLD